MDIRSRARPRWSSSRSLPGFHCRWETISLNKAMHPSRFPSPFVRTVKRDPPLSTVIVCCIGVAILSLQSPGCCPIVITTQHHCPCRNFRTTAPKGVSARVNRGVVFRESRFSALTNAIIVPRIRSSKTLSIRRLVAVAAPEDAQDCGIGAHDYVQREGPMDACFQNAASFGAPLFDTEPHIPYAEPCRIAAASAVQRTSARL